MIGKTVTWAVVGVVGAVSAVLAYTKDEGTSAAVGITAGVIVAVVGLGLAFASSRRSQ